MKISITGHTSGLGQALFNHWSNAGHNLTGFSLSNGFNIDTDIEKISDAEFDVFINNALPQQMQYLSGILDLLQLTIFKKQILKLIINLISFN